MSGLSFAEYVCFIAEKPEGERQQFLLDIRPPLDASLRLWQAWSETVRRVEHKAEALERRA